jgi:hypothetical protein
MGERVIKLTRKKWHKKCALRRDSHNRDSELIRDSRNRNKGNPKTFAQLALAYCLTSEQLACPNLMESGLAILLVISIYLIRD